MAKTASQRRTSKRTRSLADLAAHDPAQFKRALATYLEGWVAQAQFRARRFEYAQGSAQPLKAFDVLATARELLANATREAGAKQAHQILQTLAHECAKAVAANGDSRSYRLRASLVAEIGRL